MKNIWKKPTAFVLALLMLATMVPFQTTVLAAQALESPSVVTDDGNTVQKNTGIVEIDGKWYGFDENGVKIESGWVADGSYWGWAKEDENGELARDEAYLLTDNGKYAVFDEECHQVTDGWYTTTDGKTYYQDASTGYRVAIGRKKIEGNWYAFDMSGVKVKNGWIWDGVDYYWAKEDQDGQLVCDEIYLLTDNNKYAVFDKEGHQVTDGWYTAGDGMTYYQDASTGYRVATGCKIIDGKIYLFDDTTGALQKTPGWYQSGGNTYYLQADGSCATGVVQIGGNWYGFSENGAKIQNGWVADGGYWGWAKETENGELACDEAYLLTDNNQYAVFDKEGHQVTDGWYTTGSGMTYYQDASTGYRVATGQKTIGGKTYQFDNTGVLQTTGGWVVIGGNTYYQQADGSYATGIVKIDGNWYGFNADGVKVENGWVADGSYWGWAKGSENGQLACDEAYLLSDNTYAVFDKECHQVTDGWYTTGSGKTYYQDLSTGYRVSTGKKQIEGKWYWFDKTGVKTESGWVADGSYWCWAKESENGALVCDGAYLLTDNNKYAVFDEECHQVTDGWYTTKDGKTYYQDASTGYRAATGKKKISGEWYWFDESGVKTESGWIADGDDWSWAKQTENGALACDEVYLLSDNTYAVFDKECHQVTDGWYTTENGKTFYQDITTGYRTAKGYFTVAEKLYYFDSTGELFVPSAAGFYTKENKKYYFRADGSIVQPPTIDSITTSIGSGGKIKVTINATFSDSTPATTAYSFDGGATWQKSSSKDFASGTVIASGKIRIRDNYGYITVYDEEVSLSSGSSVGFGIDVSAHQGPIDWAAMAQDGVQFAIIRAVSWSGSSIVEDPYFRTNVRQAKENGILVGAYIYSYAYNTTEMAQEVDKFHAAAQALEAEGYTMDMPVFIDYEDPMLYDPDKGNPGMPTDSKTRTDILRFGMDRLEAYGYYPGFYTFLNFANNYINGRQLMEEGYDFWLAHWDVSSPAWTDVELWQYGTASVGGRNVDANYCYKDYTELIHGSGGGSHVETEETITVYDLNTGKAVTDTVTNILEQIVANEIGNTLLGGSKGVAATGENAQRAYEVQAVAAHSWITYQYANNYASEANPPKVGLKPLSSIANQTYRDLIIAAVNKVKDDYITYDGEVALTPYYACSGGKTNDSSDYWGRSLPYLVTVDLGSYEKDLVNRTGLKDYQPVQMTRTRAQLQKDILAVQPNADLSGSLSTWIEPYDRNDAGYYTKVKLGGVETDIDAFYEGVVGAYSPNFEMQVNGEDSITFTSYGYGHCVGMSQYAMIQMASLGTMSTAQIATYFFPGTEYQTIG